MLNLLSNRKYLLGITNTNVLAGCLHVTDDILFQNPFEGDVACLRTFPQLTQCLVHSLLLVNLAKMPLKGRKVKHGSVLRRQFGHWETVSMFLTCSRISF